MEKSMPCTNNYTYPQNNPDAPPICGHNVWKTPFCLGEKRKIRNPFNTNFPSSASFPRHRLLWRHCDQSHPHSLPSPNRSTDVLTLDEKGKVMPRLWLRNVLKLASFFFSFIFFRQIFQFSGNAFFVERNAPVISSRIILVTEFLMLDFSQRGVLWQPETQWSVTKKPLEGFRNYFFEVILSEKMVFAGGKYLALHSFLERDFGI